MQRGSTILRLVIFLLISCLVKVMDVRGAGLETGGTQGVSHWAYIWQRVWTSALCRSLAEHAEEFSALDVFAAEISFQGKPIIFTVDPQWETLSRFKGDIGLVVRIGSCKSEFRNDSFESGLILSACKRAIDAAAKQGIRVAELQIDFDASTTQLQSYARLLLFIRERIGSVKLVITTLPTWMQSHEFPGLLQCVDGYVLQVHSLEKPKNISDPISLCSAGGACRQIRKASTFGRPFRVALPTYGYRMLFDSFGSKFIGLEAEGPATEWSPGMRRREIWAETSEVAYVVRFLSKERVEYCGGISWFRFPTGKDELCWRWATLAEVMKGRTPGVKLKMETPRNHDGACDLVLKNEGTDRWIAREAIALQWNSASLVASDTIKGWRLEHRGENGVYLHPPLEEIRLSLQPGDTLKIGWLRLSRDVEVSVKDNP
ncbi:MAG: DUF3142 domain-containing protein [Nibricoccus sp.]